MRCCAGEIKFSRGDLIVPAPRCTLGQTRILQPTLDYLPFVVICLYFFLLVVFDCFFFFFRGLQVCII